MTEPRKLTLAFLAGDLGFSGSTVAARTLGRALIERGHTVETLCAGGGMLPDFAKAQIPVVIVESLREGHFGFWVTRRVAARLRASKAQLLHVHAPAVADLGARVATRVKLPYFLRIDSLLDPAQPLPLARKWLRGIFAASQTVREHLVNEMKLPKALIQVLPPAVELDRIRPAPPFPGTDAPVIGSLGPLEPGYGHDLFLRAAKDLLGAGREAQFLVIGEGSEGDALRKLAGELGIIKNVVFLPDPSKYAALLAGVDVLVVPAQVAGVTTTLLPEGMAYGKPVVAAAVGEVYEMLRDGETGLVVPKDDAGAIGARVAELIDAPERARALGAAARRHVEETCAPDALAAATLAAYEAALGAAGTA